LVSVFLPGNRTLKSAMPRVSGTRNKPLAPDHMCSPSPGFMSHFTRDGYTLRAWGPGHRLGSAARSVGRHCGVKASGSTGPGALRVE
jgi:hypothetical protein